MAHVLVVDDRAPNRELVRSLLTHFGHRISEAGDGVEALYKMHEEVPDLVISDIVMPLMDGMELVRRMRMDERLSAIPVIYYTATYRAREAKSIAAEVGVRWILPKPCEPRAMLAAVYEALAEPFPAIPSAAPGETGTAPSPTSPLTANLRGIDRLNQDLAQLLQAALEITARQHEGVSAVTRLDEALESVQSLGLRLAALLELGLEVGAEHEPEKILDLFSRATQDMLTSRYAGIAIVDEGGAVRHFSSRGLPAGAQAAVAAAIGKMEPTIRATFQERPVRTEGDSVIVAPGHPAVSSFLVAPVSAHGQKFGWMYAADRMGKTAFTDEDERIAQAIATQIGVSWDNVMLYGELERHASQLRQEVGERRKAEEELRDTRQRLAGLVDSAMDAIVTIDDAQRITLFNPAAEKMFGYSQAEMLGKPLDVLIPESLRRQHVADSAPFASTGVTSRRMGALAAVNGVRKDGIHFPLEASISQHEAGGRKLFTAILRDITDRLRAEEKIRNINVELEVRVARRTADLEAANRELSTFDYSISHDLRAPINRIGGFSAMLKDEYGALLGERGSDLLGRINKAADKMNQLVADLLALSTASRRELRWSEVNLTAMAHTILDGLRASDTGREVKIGIEDGLVVRADPGLMRVVLDNLLHNAWKFTSKRDNSCIEVGMVEAEGTRAVFVRDNGEGFDSEAATELFKPFRRFHEGSDFEGTGIGLATVQRIVDRHGGRTWARSAPKEGATFYFTLGREIAAPARTA